MLRDLRNAAWRRKPHLRARARPQLLAHRPRPPSRADRRRLRLFPPSAPGDAEGGKADLHDRLGPRHKDRPRRARRQGRPAGPSRPVPLLAGQAPAGPQDQHPRLGRDGLFGPRARHHPGADGGVAGEPPDRVPPRHRPSPRGQPPPEDRRHRRQPRLLRRNRRHRRPLGPPRASRRRSRPPPPDHPPPLSAVARRHHGAGRRRRARPRRPGSPALGGRDRGPADEHGRRRRRLAGRARARFPRRRRRHRPNPRRARPLGAAARDRGACSST